MGGGRNREGVRGEGEGSSRGGAEARGGGAVSDSSKPRSSCAGGLCTAVSFVQAFGRLAPVETGSLIL